MGWYRLMGTAVMERRSKPTFNETERTKALLALAHWNGNGRKASQELAQDGLEIDQKTLWRWSRKQHVAEYERIRAEVLPIVETRAAEGYANLAARQIEVAHRITDRLEANIEEIPPRDLPAANKNTVTAAAISTDKAQLLNDRPTSIIQRSASDVLRSLKSKGFDIDAEVESEETVAS